MNTKTIQTQQGLIVWDSFRGSFTMLMNTVALLIECKIAYDVELYTPKPRLFFKMHKTDGLQQETRKVIEEDIFSTDYKVEALDDVVLSFRFSDFIDDYTLDKEEKSQIHKDRIAFGLAIDNLVTV